MTRGHFKHISVVSTNLIFVSLHSRSYPLKSVRIKVLTTFEHYSPHEVQTKMSHIHPIGNCTTFVTIKENVSNKYDTQNIACIFVQHVQLIYDDSILFY